MPCELLVVAVPKIYGGWRKGAVCTIKDLPCSWGSKECPPNWVIVRLTDATKAQVEQFLGTWWAGVFKTSIVAEDARGYRVRLEIDPTTVSLSGLNRSVKLEVRDYLVAIWNAKLVSYADDNAVFDIPKPVILANVLKDLIETFRSQYEQRRYYFASSDVDLALSSGGVIELTRSQALARVQDRLME